MWTSMRARWNRGSLNSLPIVVCTPEQVSVIMPQLCSEKHAEVSCSTLKASVSCHLSQNNI